MRLLLKTAALMFIFCALSSASIVEAPVPQFPKPQAIPSISNQPPIIQEQVKSPSSSILQVHQQMLNNYLKNNPNGNLDNGKDNSINGVRNVIEKGDKNNISGSKNFLNGSENKVNGDGNVVKGQNNYVQGSGNVIMDGPYTGKFPLIPQIKPAIQQPQKSQKQNAEIDENKNLEQKQIKQSNAKLSKGENSIYACFILLLLTLFLL